MQVTFDQWPYPKFVAHRGAGKLAPENTLAAMRHGASFCYRMFEFDVKLSADDVPYLLHDATLTRTTNGEGEARGKTFTELSALDAGAWHSSPYAGEPIPRLEAIARWTQANGLMVNIEIKPIPGQEAHTGKRVAQMAAQLWQGQTVPALLSSFSEVALQEAMAAAPGLPRALLVEGVPSDWLARCKALNCAGFDPNWRGLSPDLIHEAHANQLRVLSYTINDPVRATELLGWGLDCLITDAVDLISPT